MPLRTCRAAVDRTRRVHRRRILPDPRTLLAAAAITCMAAAQPAPVAIETIRTSIGNWLVSEKLTPALEIAKLRHVSSPDNPEQRLLRLELLFVPKTTDVDKEFKRFEELLSAYAASRGVGLPERLFYKLAHTSALPRSGVEVHFLLRGDSYAIRYDAARPGVILEVVRQRDVHKTVELLTGDGMTGRAAAASSPLDARRIQDFLADYFLRHNQEAKLPEPRIHREPIEADYAAIDVWGIRKQVILDRGYWEHLQISVVLSGHGQRLNCFTDGQFASGVGTKLPDQSAYLDMEPRHKADLERFVNGLLEQLQQSFRRP